MSRPNGYSSSPSAPPMPPSWQQPAGYGTQTPNSQPSPSSSPYSQAYSQAYSQPYAQPYSGVPPYAGGAGLPSYAYPAQYSGGYMQSLFPPGTDLEIIRAFEAADTDGSGVVDEYELRRTLSTIQNFSERTARLMIHLFGIKNSLKLGELHIRMRHKKEQGRAAVLDVETGPRSFQHCGERSKNGRVFLRGLTGIAVELLIRLKCEMHSLVLVMRSHLQFLSVFFRSMIGLVRLRQWTITAL